jgi:hypothetical protein
LLGFGLILTALLVPFGSHTKAVLWKKDLAEFLKKTEQR